MRPIHKKPTPTQPLDLRIRGLLPLISTDDAQTIDHIVRIVAKPSLSCEDLQELKADLLKLRPTLRKHQVWYKALTEIGVDLDRDMMTLTRLLGPVRKKKNEETKHSPRHSAGQSTATVPAADQSITSQCQRAVEKAFGRRVRHTVRRESRPEFRKRALREARATSSPEGSASDPEDIPFMLDLARELGIDPTDLLCALERMLGMRRLTLPVN